MGALDCHRDTMARFVVAYSQESGVLIERRNSRSSLANVCSVGRRALRISSNISFSGAERKPAIRLHGWKIVISVGKFVVVEN